MSAWQSFFLNPLLNKTYMIDWLINDWVEIVAVITGLAYIFLSIRQNIWCWFYGIISSFLYLFVCFHSKIYADMTLQAYYVVMGIYGWVHWAKMNESSTGEELQVLRYNAREWLWVVIITTVLYVVIGEFLIHLTDSPIPWIDSFTTALSFTATWMLARKILEHWLFWIVVNIVSIGLYFYRGLYATIILFAVLAVMAFIGYFEWKKAWNQAKVNIATL